MMVFTLKNKPLVFKCVLLVVGFIIAMLLFSPDGEKSDKKKDEAANASISTDGKVQAGTEDNQTEAALSPDALGQEDFFSTFRTQRQMQRSEEEELYQNFLGDDALTAEEKQGTMERLEALYSKNSLENNLETILKGRNYEDVIFSYQDPLSLLIIKGNVLSDGDRASLEEFVNVYCGVEPGNLSIFTVK